MSNLSSLLIVFYKFFAGIALSDVRLYFSLILVTKAKLLKGKLLQLHYYITSIISPYM